MMEQIESTKKILYDQFGEIVQSQNHSTKSHSLIYLDKKHPKLKKTVKENNKERFRKYLTGKKNGKTPSATGELDLYLQEPTIKIDSPSLKFLEWWRFNTLRFPTLSIMEKQLLLTPMSSIALESAFSTGCCVLNNFQSRLKADTLETLICVQDCICADEEFSGCDLDPEIEGECNGQG